MKWLKWTVLAIALSSVELATSPMSIAHPNESNSAITQSTPNNSQQLPPLIDRELFFGNPEITGAKLSPDGKFLAFQKPLNGVINVWVKPIDAPFDDARPVTSDTDSPIIFYSWNRDGNYILYGQDKGGNENFHLYAVDPAAVASDSTPPPARNLTPLDGVQARLYEGPENDPNTLIIGLNDRDPQVHDVYRLNISTGERELLLKNEENIANWVVDLQGNIRFAVRQTSDGGTEILRVEGDKLLSEYTCGFEEACNPVRVHKDGKRLYLETNKGEDVDLTRLVLYNPETKESELIDVDPEKEVDFGGALFSEATDELLVTSYVGDRLRIYPKNEEIARDLEILQKALPEGDISLASMTEDDRLLLIKVSRDVDPGSTYLFNRDTGEVEKLYASRPELPTQHLASMRPLRYTARDGMEIPAYLTLPKGVEPRNLPVIIFPHGGPWSRDTWGYDGFAQFLANRGYAVFQPNFRGSTGYGKAFLNAGNREWGTGAMQHDITDGVQYLIEQGIADRDRVGIFGGSYGGYATLAGLAFTPDLYAAGISLVGPSNLITLIQSIPPYWGPIAKLFTLRVGDPENPEDRSRLIEQSPLFSAKKIQAPLLVIQGANDPRVKQAESDQIVVALRELEQDVEYLIAPDEGHGFRKETNRLAVAVAVEQFFARYLGGRAQEEVPSEIQSQLESLTVDINKVAVPESE
ncbi:S9 family peptidase [Lusitaniella coriacea LEGE 07157]|uniref:S9 family peptidase n=1 Tax=Lusitaniella coriacea LEGE 07157 TaxID=945747 RepID=A0A8J7DLE6_9CYAN|nr:S9 family peptidase [Lusitaniella coriacea]MBE9114908.1 S9 family peptidase [Lusitaniella coriacea LEGE 07157]